MRAILEKREAIRQRERAVIVAARTWFVTPVTAASALRLAVDVLLTAEAELAALREEPEA